VMRQPLEQGAARSLVALVAALAFVLHPFAALAQQPDGEPAQEEEDGEQPEDGEETEPSGPTPELYVLSAVAVQEGMSSIIPERISEMQRRQLEGENAVDLLPPFERLQRQAGGQANAAVSEAKRLYTSGIGLLAAGEDEEAAKTFQKAVDMMEQHIAELDNFSVLSDAYKNLALAYHNAGFDFDARKKMAVYAHLEPDQTLDPERFPSELREVYDDETSKVERGGPGKLVIEIDRDEAMVFIDGKSYGSAPTTIEEIGYGYHYMVVRGADGSVWAEQIRVRGRGKEQTFEVELGAGAAAAEDGEDGEQLPAFYSGIISTIQTGSFGKDLQPYLAELVTRTGVDYVAWVAIVKQGRAYEAVPFVYRASDGLMVRADSVEFNRELSNLRVGVTRLARHIVAAVEEMPEDKAFTSVELLEPEPEPDPVVEVDPEEPADQEQDESEEGEEVAAAPASEEPESVEPPPEPSEKAGETDSWVWVGAGGAAVLVTGLVVGGIVLMSGDDEPSNNFDAQISW
jgi:hypothetical protein